jgi:tetratricopeptide (TPR) repeat protein
MRTLIGRDHPAAILGAEITRAARSHGGLVLVTGEAGIGKTTLVTGAAEGAREQGCVVLSGTCWDSESAPGYWPWVQVMRALRRAATPEERAAAESAAGPALAVLLGEQTGSDTVDEFQLYDAVTTALVALSQHRPVVVVLDDLHWADLASIRLLEFAARHTWFERLLIIGTYRDVEVEATDHPLRPLILPLLARATTVTLTGLDRDEVGTLIERTVGRAPDGELITEVHRRTGGNPFFVEQTARLWHGGGAITTVAPGVRDALRHRLSLLPDRVVRVLTTAAVLGREFQRQVLAAASAQPAAAADRMLDEALAARLVVALGAGRFSFAHDLVRETLYESLDETEARRQHAAVVRAADGDSLLPADLARHAYLAGDELEPDKAVDLLLAASHDAGRRLASDEASGHLRRAVERVNGCAPHRRVLVTLDYGRELAHLGDTEGAWRNYREALALARKLDDAALLGRLALVLYGTSGPPDAKQLQRELLIEAHARLVPDADSGQALEKLAQELAMRVAALARGGDDDDTLSFGLWARHNAIIGPGSAEERLALTDELIEFARRTGDHETEYIAASFRWVALLEQGDPGYLKQFDAFRAVVERDGSLRGRLGSYVDTSIIATLAGRFAEASSLLDEVAAGYPDAEHAYFLDMMERHIRWSLLLLQGRFDELDVLLAKLRERDHPRLGLLEGITAAQRGDAETALRHLREVEPPDLPHTPLWMRFLAQTAASIKDPSLCEQARAALAPYAGGWAVSLWGCDVSGPMLLWSALVDAAQERWDEAISGFTAAAESADRLRARPWAVEARMGLGAALLARGDAAAASVLAEVEREASDLGMRHILARLSTMDTGEAGPANEFRLVDDVWVLSMAGHTVHMPDAKGLRDLHTLIGSPGNDIRAVELLDPDGGELVVAARSLGGDQVLDEQARAAYQRRLATLDEEIDRAAELGDDHKAAQLDRERAALLDELRVAAGLGGRTRRLGDEAERARKTVTARIRDTLRKLDDRHPELAAHLRASVSTGAICRYQPETGVTWRR